MSLSLHPKLKLPSFNRVTPTHDFSSFRMTFSVSQVKLIKFNIIVIQLSNGRESSDTDGHLQQISDLEDMLSIKQMEVDVLVMLDKHRSPLSKPLETDHLSRYILSLGSLCKDQRRFNNHDLITLLQHHEPTQDDEFALATLAACSSATHVRKRQIRRLLDIASGEITNVGE